MNKLLIVILSLSILGNVGGVFLAYQFLQLRRQVNSLQTTARDSEKSISFLMEKAEQNCTHRMVFLHHSVGKGVLVGGGLRESLRQLGIAVRGITYGDSIGQNTDMCDWLPKFQKNMDGILTFRDHPNTYFTDGRINDIVMFKSCYPNSDITADGSEPGDPLNSRQTLADYKAVMQGIAGEMQKYPRTLFIYLTFPPLVPVATTPTNANRARTFNLWLTREFLPSYRITDSSSNFFVFDLFDVLADNQNYLKEEYRGANSRDSHPNAKANSDAAAKFLEFFKPVWASWLAKSRL